MNEPRRRLDVEIVRLGLATSRTRAVEMIARGLVHVDGAVSTKASLDVVDRIVTVAADPSGPGLASRGGHKLAGALADLPDMPVPGRRCLDAGASTGGFTDVLLRARGAARWSPSTSATASSRGACARTRGSVLDRTNVRTLTAQTIGGPVELTVADLSFISLTLVLPALAACTAAGGDLLPMVKPQFEVGRERLGRGGVVRDSVSRADAVLEVARPCAGAGLGSPPAVAQPAARARGQRGILPVAAPRRGRAGGGHRARSRNPRCPGRSVRVGPVTRSASERVTIDATRRSDAATRSGRRDAEMIASQ